MNTKDFPSSEISAIFDRERRNVMARQVALRRRQDSQMQRLRDLQQKKTEEHPHERDVDTNNMNLSSQPSLHPPPSQQDQLFPKIQNGSNLPIVNPIVIPNYPFRAGLLTNHAQTDGMLLYIFLKQNKKHPDSNPTQCQTNNPTFAEPSKCLLQLNRIEYCVNWFFIASSFQTKLR